MSQKLPNSYVHETGVRCILMLYVVGKLGKSVSFYHEKLSGIYCLTHQKCSMYG